MSLLSCSRVPSGSGMKGSAPGEDRVGQKGRSRDMGGTCLMVTRGLGAGKGCGDRQGIPACELAGGERRSWHLWGERKRRQAGFLTFTYKIKAP